MKRRESKIQKAVCDFAKKNGWVVLKPDPLHYRGIPDRLFMKGFRVFFIEFKATGMRPSEHQKRVHEVIKEKTDFPVYIVDDEEFGKSLFRCIQ